MTIRYIKLGKGGFWAKDCIETDNTIRLGYESNQHQESLDGNWDAVKAKWLEIRNGSKHTASNDVRQIREFYEAPEDDIWITFHNRKLFWCKAFSEVTELQEDGSRVRKTIGSWSDTNEKGQVLSVDNLDGRVLTTQGYQGTICSLKEWEEGYLYRKIKGEEEPVVAQIKQDMSNLRLSVAELVKGLWWHDFELLIDLIFSKTGWHRYSVVGKTEKDIDLDLFSPSTNRRAFVQIKSKTDKNEFDRYEEIYREHEGQYAEYFFVYHTASYALAEGVNLRDNCHVWDLDEISKLVIQTGLIDWLIAKRS